MTTPYLSLARVEFEYEAQTEDELSVSEDQLVWVLEDDDAEWFKVKVKVADSTGPIGLVPASYLAVPSSLKQVIAAFAYSPSRNESGQLDNEEEIEVEEGDKLTLFEEEGDWVLVGRLNGKGVGFVPATYVTDVESTPIEPPPAPVAAYVAPAERVVKATNGAPKAGDVKTWSVSEVDSKKKKKKGTLGVGNGVVFFASESDKTPVQQYPLSTLIEITSEKSKHLHLSFPDSVELHFMIGSKEAFDEVLAKIEEGRSVPVVISTPSVRFVPPPPPLDNEVEKSYSPPPAFIPPRPVIAKSENGDAVALYDFEAQGDDELNMIEGERLVVIVGGSDDADWIKCRKAGSNEEGVVPASYIQPDEEPERRMSEEDQLEAEAQAADALALQNQIRQDQKSAEERRAAKKVQSDRESRDATRTIDAAAESARQKRLSRAPVASPIPVPQSGDEYSRNGTRSKGSESKSNGTKKPSASRIRTWKDRTGQFKVEAEFLGLNGNKIRLHKLNGVIIEVPIEKMSTEDTAYLKKVTTRQGSGDDDVPLAQIADREQRRDERHRRGQIAAGATLSIPPARAKAPAKKSMDWFEFFLNAGCEMDDCTRYATNFQRDRIEEDVLVDLEQSTMRSLGLREGDIIRVSKYIQQKFKPPPTPDKSDRDARIAADAAMARSMAEGNDASPGLFTNANGGLKTTRRGRPPTSRQASTAVDSASIATATSELAKLGNSPPISRVPSPPTVNVNGSSNLMASASGGFDDDAWTVKAPVKPATPPILAAIIPAPAQPATPTAPPAPTLSYNDGLLAQMGIGNRPPSVPILSPQYPNSFSPVPSPSLLGPRGPITPIYANQPLLNPLIPTQTGMNSFIPTRAPQLMPNLTGYPMQGMGGYASMMPQMTGMPQQQQQPISMQPSGYGQLPQQQLQPQQTGMYQQNQSFNSLQQNQRFGQAPPLPIQFNPTPPPSASTPPPPASTTAQFQPSNVFASMKPGGFANSTGPQEPSRYDALRPQPTGVFSPGLMPQPTGFQPGYIQPQPTGYYQPPQQQQQQQQQNGYRQY